MGLTTIRVVAFLDIILAATVITQQIWYTADQLQNNSNGIVTVEEEKVTEPTLKCQIPVIFPTDKMMATGKEPKFTTDIPKEWLWPLLFMVMGMCSFSIFASGALFNSAKAKTNKEYHHCYEMFTTWVKCYAFSFLVTVIFAVVGYHISIIVIYCIIYISLRGAFALVLSEEFVSLALSIPSIYERRDENGNFEEPKKSAELKTDELNGNLDNEDIATYLVIEIPSDEQDSAGSIANA